MTCLKAVFLPWHFCLPPNSQCHLASPYLRDHEAFDEKCLFLGCNTQGLVLRRQASRIYQSKDWSLCGDLWLIMHATGCKPGSTQTVHLWLSRWAIYRQQKNYQSPHQGLHKGGGETSQMTGLIYQSNCKAENLITSLYTAHIVGYYVQETG